MFTRSIADCFFFSFFVLFLAISRFAPTGCRVLIISSLLLLNFYINILYSPFLFSFKLLALHGCVLFFFFAVAFISAAYTFILSSIPSLSQSMLRILIAYMKRTAPITFLLTVVTLLPGKAFSNTFSTAKETSRSFCTKTHALGALSPKTWDTLWICNNFPLLRFVATFFSSLFTSLTLLIICHSSLKRCYHDCNSTVEDNISSVLYHEERARPFPLDLVSQKTSLDRHTVVEVKTRNEKNLYRFRSCVSSIGSSEHDLLVGMNKVAEKNPLDQLETPGTL